LAQLAAAVHRHCDADAIVELAAAGPAVRHAAQTSVVSTTQARVMSRRSSQSNRDRIAVSMSMSVGRIR